MFKGKENTIYDLMIGNNKKYAAKYTHKSVIKHRGMFFATQRGCFQNDTRIIVFFFSFYFAPEYSNFCISVQKKNIYDHAIFCLIQNFTYYLTVVFIVAFKISVRNQTLNSNVILRREATSSIQSCFFFSCGRNFSFSLPLHMCDALNQKSIKFIFVGPNFSSYKSQYYNP